MSSIILIKNIIIVLKDTKTKNLISLSTHLNIMEFEGLEIERRLVHMSGIIFPILYLLFLDKVEIIGILTLAVIIASFIEFMRLKKDYSNVLFDKLTRDYESEKIAGYHLYLVGMLVSSIIYDPLIAICAMFLVAICDPVGGILSDADAEESKSMLPFFGVLLCGFIISSIVLIGEYEPYIVGAVSVMAGIGAAIGDFKKLSPNGYIIDDNLVIPVLSGLLSQLTIWVFVFF